MASNMYLKFEGPAIQGECSDANHKNEIEVHAWNHGFTQPTSPLRSSAGAGTVERAHHADFTFTKYLDSSTDDLLKHCWSGKQISKATLTCYRADGNNKPIEYLKVAMEQVIIANVSLGGGGGDLPVENVALSYGKVQYVYNPQKKEDGTSGPAQQPIAHDLKTNTVS